MAHGGGGHIRHDRGADRHIPKVMVQVDNRPIGVRRLYCASPGCGQQGEIFDRAHDGLPVSFVERKFREKGWDVGSSEKHDFCPKCVEARRFERRSRKVKPLMRPAAEFYNGTTAVAPPPLTRSQEEPKPMTPTAADAPVEMARSDKRVIFAKLEEVYIDEKAGYRTPWTDAGVAKDLGVPAGWVAAVRDENFGPANDNGEIRDMLARVETAAREAQAVLGEAKAIRSDGSALVARINEVAHKVTEIGKTLSGLLTIADRIEKSLKP